LKIAAIFSRLSAKSLWKKEKKNRKKEKKKANYTNHDPQSPSALSRVLQSNMYLALDSFGKWYNHAGFFFAYPSMLYK
jgi:hypothetical protein